MMRLFRKVKDEIPVSSMNECITKIEALVAELEQKIAEIDSKLRDFKDQMAKMRECPSKHMMKAKAFRLLNSRKQYTNQVKSLRTHSLHMKQTIFVAQSINAKKAKAEPPAKTSNLMSEKLSLLYNKVVKQRK